MANQQSEYTKNPRPHEIQISLSPCKFQTIVSLALGKPSITRLGFKFPMSRTSIPTFPRKYKLLAMDVWQWISELPRSESDFPVFFELASSKENNSTRSMQLRAEKAFASGSDEPYWTFTLSINGFRPTGAPTDLWVSDKCPLSSDKPFLPLLVQLLQEIIFRSPTAHDSTCPRSQLQKLKPGPISWIIDSHSSESFSSFFNIVFLLRLFWLCVCDAPSEVGGFYFYHLLSPGLEKFPFERSRILRTFLITVGVDAELCFMRAAGYMIAKWLILKEVGTVKLLNSTAPTGSTATAQKLRFSYATEVNGLWIMKGYAPVMVARVVRTPLDGQKSEFPLLVGAKETALKYALAHQQLEVVLQFEYSVRFHEGYIQVNTRVDNLRFHVARLGFNKDEEGQFGEERHFVSRLRVWVGPEIGATYVGGLSLGRSTDNREKEVKVHKIIKGRSGKSGTSVFKAASKMSTRTRFKNWRWDQEAEGNAVVFDAALCDTTTGDEVAVWKMSSQKEDGSIRGDKMEKRYEGTGRAFTKNGGVVFAGDEYGEEVGWRLSREVEGNVLKWRIGGHFWVSYFPNESTNSYWETRCVEMCDEVDLPLIPPKSNA